MRLQRAALSPAPQPDAPKAWQEAKEQIDSGWHSPTGAIQTDATAMRGAAVKCCEQWIEVYGAKNPQFVTAQSWAVDAIKDIADQIRALPLAQPDTRDATIQALVEALEHAKEIIKTWHGLTVWNIYRQNSSEMKQIDAALAAASGRAKP